MFLKYPIICLHIYCYSNKALPLPPPQESSSSNTYMFWVICGKAYGEDHTPSTCYKEIGLCAQNKDTTLGSIVYTNVKVDVIV